MGVQVPPTTETNAPRGPVAGGVVQSYDVEAVNRKEDRQLYATRQKVYPKRAHGTFRSVKWLLMAITLGIYYVIPWIRWDRGPDLPDQAVLLDLATQRFFMFGLELWPQEFYFVTGILVLAALALFLITSLAGRIWCGYFCPQTVWTDLMVAVERFWQGDRNARMRLDKAPWSADKIFKKTATHLTWLAIAVATGGAFVFYFADAPTLFYNIVTGNAAIEAYAFIAILTLTTYGLGGIAREQVCIYMCPWPRIQGAMVDHDTYLVGYKEHRGEPRGSHKKDQSWEGRGDCVDCKACVVVCPMGIDIRDGSQLECIQCALCIDACNDIMHKVGRPQNLIAYDTIANQEAATTGTTARPTLLRARTLIYAALIAVLSLAMMWGISQRSLLDVSVIADRNPYFVRLSNGDIRNGFTIKILNKRHEPRQYEIGIDGLPSASVRIQNLQRDAQVVRVPTDVIGEFRAFVIVEKAAIDDVAKHGQPFSFVVRDVESGDLVHKLATFRRPPK